jgi:DNA-binding transcriptional LysR family regulator
VRSVLFAQVEAFVEIARQGTMRRAAEALALSQPALTARVHGLESELGASLFRRSRSGMELTGAGRAFLPHAERAIDAIRTGSALIRELEMGVVGELTLGVAPAVSAYVLPDLLARFTADHPDVRLLVRTGHSEEIIDLVLRGEVELGIVREVRDSRVAMRPLYEDELVLVVPRDHPFAAAGRIDVAEMQHAQLIMFDRTSSYSELTNAMFRSAGVVPRGVTELDNIEAAKRMVERGLGVALLPGTAVADALEAGSVREVELMGAGPVRRRIVLVERPGDLVKLPLVLAFTALLDRIPEIIPGARPASPA